MLRLLLSQGGWRQRLLSPAASYAHRWLGQHISAVLSFREGADLISRWRMRLSPCCAARTRRLERFLKQQLEFFSTFDRIIYF